jgi:hypothetical protein
LVGGGNNMLTWAFTCPTAAQVAAQFTATSTSFTTLDNQMQVETFTKQ